jgi:hypothetical protein
MTLPSSTYEPEPAKPVKRKAATRRTKKPAVVAKTWKARKPVAKAKVVSKRVKKNAV